MKNKLLTIVVTSIVLAACGNIADEVDNVAHPIRTGVIENGEASIEYFAQGEGEVVVLLSGRGLDVGYLGPLAAALADAGLQTIRINRRGAGKSTGPLENIDYRTHATDVAGVVQALDMMPVSVLGHALGDRIVRVFGANYPGLTRSVILIPASGKVQGDPEEARATSKMFRPDATDAEIREGMKYMVGDPADSERVWQIIEPSKLTNPAALKSEATMEMPIIDWWAPPGNTSYLVIHGMRDRSAPPENAQLLQQDLGQRMTLVELSDAGHLVLVESPTEVAGFPHRKSALFRMRVLAPGSLSVAV